MRKPSIILLLSLMLIPLLWNGINLIHYLVEHTHTFCASEQDHQHPSTEDCRTICYISTQHEESQIPHQSIVFYELKQCITTPFPFLKKQLLFFKTISTISNYLILHGRILSDELLRPPIS